MKFLILFIVIFILCGCTDNNSHGFLKKPLNEDTEYINLYGSNKEALIQSKPILFIHSENLPAGELEFSDSIILSLEQEGGLYDFFIELRDLNNRKVKKLFKKYKVKFNYE